MRTAQARAFQGRDRGGYREEWVCWEDHKLLFCRISAFSCWAVDHTKHLSALTYGQCASVRPAELSVAFACRAVQYPHHYFWFHHTVSGPPLLQNDDQAPLGLKYLFLMSTGASPRATSTPTFLHTLASCSSFFCPRIFAHDGLQPRTFSNFSSLSLSSSVTLPSSPSPVYLSPPRAVLLGTRQDQASSGPSSTVHAPHLPARCTSLGGRHLGPCSTHHDSPGP